MRLTQRRIYQAVAVLGLFLGTYSPSVPAADTPTVEQLTQQGLEASRRGDLNVAIVQWQQALDVMRSQTPTVETVDLNLRAAEAYKALGRHAKAAEHLTAAQRLSLELQDWSRQTRVLA